MKKFIILSLFLFSSLALFSQQRESTDDSFTRKGTVLIETGYNLIGGFGAGGTGLTSYSSDGQTISSLGAEGGYFVTENLAVKIAISFLSIENEDNDDDANLGSTSLGLKYYIIGKIPIDLTYGRLSSGDDSAGIGNFSVGYAFRLADNIALEPSLGAVFGEDDGLAKLSVKFAMFL